MASWRVPGVCMRERAFMEWWVDEMVDTRRDCMKWESGRIKQVAYQNITRNCSNSIDKLTYVGHGEGVARMRLCTLVHIGQLDMRPAGKELARAAKHLQRTIFWWLVSVFLGVCLKSAWRVEKKKSVPLYSMNSGGSGTGAAAERSGDLT